MRVRLRLASCFFGLMMIVSAAAPASGVAPMKVTPAAAGIPLARLSSMQSGAAADDDVPPGIPFVSTDLSVYAPDMFYTFPPLGFSVTAIFVHPTPVEGAVVTFEKRRATETTWTIAGQATTDSSGRASINVTPTASAYVRARLTSEGQEVVSSELLCRARMTLSLEAPVTAPRALAFTVSGSFNPTHPAGEKTVHIMCYLNGQLVKSVGATNSGTMVLNGARFTKYSARVSLPSNGVWSLVADVPDGELNLASQAGATVRVGRPVLSAKATGGYATYFHSLHLTGTLVRSGRGLSHRRVQVQAYSISGHKWNTVKYATTDSAGRLSVYVKPRKAGQYRFRFPGDTDGFSCVSPSMWLKTCMANLAVYPGEGRSEVGPVYLTKGKHRIVIRAPYDLRKVYVYRTGWRLTLTTTRIPAGTSKTLYVTVPTSASYYIGWSLGAGTDNLGVLTVSVW